MADSLALVQVIRENISAHFTSELADRREGKRADERKEVTCVLSSAPIGVQ